MERKKNYRILGIQIILEQKESLSLQGVESCKIDYTLKSESEKFRRVGEALKGHIYLVNMRENT